MKTCVELCQRVRNLKRGAIVAIGIVFTICWAVVHAQNPKNVPTIGYLAVSSASAHTSRTDALLEGLRGLGYLEGENIVIEYRYAEGNASRLPGLAAELVRLNVDAIVTTGTTGALAAKQATSTIPIILTTAGEPVAGGLVASLARPGGNITGLTSVSRHLSGKRLELLKETVPSITRVGILWDPLDPSAAANFKETEVTARASAVQAQSLEVRNANDFDAAFKAAIEGRVQALTVISSGLINIHRRRIVDFATRSRLPTIFAQAAFVKAGGLMFYGPNTPDLYRRAATYVDKILKGSNPAELPVEQPTKFELVINLKTARALGLKIPAHVLMEADKVIE